MCEYTHKKKESSKSAFVLSLTLSLPSVIFRSPSLLLFFILDLQYPQNALGFSLTFLAKLYQNPHTDFLSSWLTRFFFICRSHIYSHLLPVSLYFFHTRCFFLSLLVHLKSISTFLLLSYLWILMSSQCPWDCRLLLHNPSYCSWIFGYPSSTDVFPQSGYSWGQGGRLILCLHDILSYW